MHRTTRTSVAKPGVNPLLAALGTAGQIVPVPCINENDDLKEAVSQDFRHFLFLASNRRRPLNNSLKQFKCHVNDTQKYSLHGNCLISCLNSLGSNCLTGSFCMPCMFRPIAPGLSLKL